MNTWICVLRVTQETSGTILPLRHNAPRLEEQDLLGGVL